MNLLQASMLLLQSLLPFLLCCMVARYAAGSQEEFWRSSVSEDCYNAYVQLLKTLGLEECGGQEPLETHASLSTYCSEVCVGAFKERLQSARDTCSKGSVPPEATKTLRLWDAIIAIDEQLFCTIMEPAETVADRKYCVLQDPIPRNCFNTMFRRYDQDESMLRQAADAENNQADGGRAAGEVLERLAPWVKRREVSESTNHGLSYRTTRPWLLWTISIMMLMVSCLLQ